MAREKNLGVEEFSTTLFEKFLAVVLAVFLFIGCMWAYFDRLNTEARVEGQSSCIERETYDSRHDPALSDSERLPGDDELFFGNDPGGANDTRTCLPRSEREAIARLAAAHRTEAAASSKVDDLVATRDEARESYRTSLDANAADQAAKTRYEAAERDLKAARQSSERATDALEAARQEATPALRHLRSVEQQRAKRDDELRDRARVRTFAYRLIFTLVILLGSFALMQHWRKRHSRWTILGMGGVGAATLLSLVMALDYLNIEDWGPLILSLAGVAVTAVVFLAYQRYLQTRIPLRRARKNQCIFCGYPVGDEAHCEGCGRASHAPCSTCGERRRVGTQHCGQCGAA